MRVDLVDLIVKKMDAFVVVLKALVTGGGEWWGWSSFRDASIRPRFLNHMGLRCAPGWHRVYLCPRPGVGDLRTIGRPLDGRWGGS